ncbi:MAG: glutamate synthase subunit beta [Sedimentisphaerales bacterium]
MANRYAIRDKRQAISKIMGEVKGFLKYKRQEPAHRPIEQRIHDFRELELPLTPDEIRRQAARCMNCGLPFCHGLGCPLRNCIPDINELVYKDRWQYACTALHSTNNFPEITSRLCPAPCEAACTLSINDEPVLIRHIEQAIVERGFQQGWIEPEPPERRSGKRVAIIGSGPAGLAAAQQLVRAGHDVTVFEKDQRPGGMLRYGIPDFKLGKWIIDRRLDQLIAEGVQFQTSVNVGEDISPAYLCKMFDCVLLAMGARHPRPLKVPGADLQNVIYAMDYLTAQNRHGQTPTKTRTNTDVSESQCSSVSESQFSAEGRVVVVIGGGDTGSDCVGTARRQGAEKIFQLEILPKPPQTRPPDTPWPMWPRIMRTSSSHEEGCERLWGVMTKHLRGDGRVQELYGCQVEWIKNADGWKLKELPDTDFVISCDLVILAMGFAHVEHEGLVENLGLQLDEKGNVAVDNFQAVPRTEGTRVFAAGDTITGASLVVHAINTGRQAAAAIDQWLRKGPNNN